MVRELAPALYVIQLRLVESPLKNLNCYVFTGGERNLMVDTGFNQQECLDDLQAGLAELKVDMDKTDLFATHFHSDHCGLIGKLVRPNNRAYMSAIDHNMMVQHELDEEGQWQRYENVYKSEGYPHDELALALEENPTRSLRPDRLPEITPLQDGDVLQVGTRKLTCILTPGHSPGHMCLYDAENQIMVLGDHVLFDITPNITAWPMMPDALAHYLISLKKIKGYPVALPLPAHRGHSCTMSERVDQLLEHHDRRLEETMRVVTARPGITGYEVAGQLTWSIRAKDWASFPPKQKWFATGETLAHLYNLVDKGLLKRREVNGIVGYYPA